MENTKQLEEFANDKYPKQENLHKLTEAFPWEHMRSGITAVYL